MQRRRPLHVKRGIIFRKHVLTVRFFAHFHVGNWIAAFLQISHLRGRVVRRVVQQGHRNHGRQPARHAAGEK